MSLRWHHKAFAMLRVLDEYGPLRWHEIRLHMGKASTSTLDALLRNGVVRKDPAPPVCNGGRASRHVYVITDSGRRRVAAFRDALGLRTTQEQRPCSSDSSTPPRSCSSSASSR